MTAYRSSRWRQIAPRRCLQSSVMPETPVDLERLLKLRLVVGRIGEMDRARWWNTQGQLGPYGALGAEARPAADAPLRPGTLGVRGGGASMLGGVRSAGLRHALAAAGGRRGGVRRAVGALAGPRGRLDAVLRADRGAGRHGRGGAAPGPGTGRRRPRWSDTGRCERRQRVARSRCRLPTRARTTDHAVLALGFGRGRQGGLAVPYARVADG